MSILFSVQNGRLLMSNNNEDLTQLTELVDFVSKISANETCQDAVKIESIAIELTCSPSKRTINLQKHGSEAQRIVSDTLSHNESCSLFVAMYKDGIEQIACQLCAKDKIGWRVIRTRNFTRRELLYFVNVLKEAHIYSFKNTHL